MAVKHGPSLALNLTCTMPNPRGSLVVRQTEHTFTSTTMGRHSETKRQIFQTGDERHCGIKSNPLAETGVGKKRSTTQESRTHIQPCVRSRRAISGACGIVERLTRREHTFILASSRLPHDSFPSPIALSSFLVHFTRSMEGKAGICGGVIAAPECRVLFEIVEWSKRKWIDCG